MAETKTILVAGATGQQGGAVARELMKRGHRVFGLTRSRSKFKDLATAGIEGVQGDLTDKTSLAPLLRNADGFFIVTTPFEPNFSVHPEKEVQQGKNAIDAAKAAKVSHVVLAIVARAFENRRMAIGKTVELAGDEIAFGDLPAALSQKLGHPIRYAEQSEEDARKLMGDDGLRMFQFFRTKGYHVDIPALETAWGYRMTRFHEFLDTVDWERAQPKW